MGARRKAKKALDALRVLEMYAAGKTWEHIVEEFGTPRDPVSKKKWNVTQLLDWAVKQAMPEALIKQARNIELQRLQDMHKAVWADAIDGDRDAISVVLKLMERRSKLLGLDSPKKMSVDGDLTIQVMKFSDDDHTSE